MNNPDSNQNDENEEALEVTEGEESFLSSIMLPVGILVGLAIIVIILGIMAL